MSAFKTIATIAIGVIGAGLIIFTVSKGIKHSVDTAGGFYYTDEEVKAQIAQCHDVDGTATVTYSGVGGDHFGQAYLVQCEGVERQKEFPPPGKPAVKDNTVEDEITQLVECWEAPSCSSSLGIPPTGFEYMDAATRRDAAQLTIEIHREEIDKILESVPVK